MAAGRAAAGSAVQRVAWLVIAVVVLRFTLASVTTEVLAFLVAAVVGFLAHDVAGRSGQGTRAAAGAAGPAAGRGMVGVSPPGRPGTDHRRC
jgi:hypothetical protein